MRGLLTMRAIIAAIAALLIGLAPVHASASRFRLIYTGSQAFPPINLNSVTYPFGGYTPRGFGGVHLSNQDVSSYGAFVFGLGLQSAGATVPTSWTIYQTSGTSGDWQLGQGSGTTIPSTAGGALTVAEGAGALTPTPSAQGVTNHLNGGPYTFSIVAKNSLGIGGTPGTITITVPGGATPTPVVNYGDLDASTGVVPTGFLTNNTTNPTIQFSVGINRTVNLGSGSNKYLFTQDFDCSGGYPCIFTWADTARPGGLLAFAQSGLMRNIQINNIILTGEPATANNFPSAIYGFWTFSNTNDYTNTNAGITMNNDGVNFASFPNPTYQQNAIVASNDYPRAAASAHDTSATVCLTVNSFVGTNVVSGFAEGGKIGFNCNPTAPVVFNDLYINGFAGNAFFVYNGCYQLTHTIVIQPARVNNQHLDYFQAANGGNPQCWIVNKFIGIQGNGYANAQGPPFAGGNDNFTGYISGGILHVVTNTTAIIPSTRLLSASWTGTAQIAKLLSGTGGAGTTASFFGFTPADVGSAGAPITFASAGMGLVQLNDLIYSGGETNGMSFNGGFGDVGTTNYIQNVTVVEYITTTADVPWTYFNATVNSATNITITATPTPIDIGFGPLETIYYADGSSVGSPTPSWANCAPPSAGHCSAVENMPKVGGVYGWNANFRSTQDYPSSVPWIQFTKVGQTSSTPSCTLPITYYGGTTTLTNIFGTGRIVNGTASPFSNSDGCFSSPVNYPPPNTTVTNAASASANHANQATLFANGDPTATMGTATWTGLSAAGIEAKVLMLLTPSGSMPKDGSGNPAGAVTVCPPPGTPPCTGVWK